MEQIVRFANWVYPPLNWQVAKGYEIEAKILAHSADALLLLGVGVFIWFVISLVKDKKSSSSLEVIVNQLRQSVDNLDTTIKDLATKIKPEQEKSAKDDKESES